MSEKREKENKPMVLIGNRMGHSIACVFETVFLVQNLSNTKAPAKRSDIFLNIVSDKRNVG